MDRTAEPCNLTVRANRGFLADEADRDLDLSLNVLRGCAAAADLTVPAWLFPSNSPAPAGRHSEVSNEALRLSGSAAVFTRALMRSI